MSVLDEIKNIFKEVEDIEISISAEDIQADSHLRDDLELDSLSVMALFSELQATHTNLDEDCLSDWYKISDIIASINSLSNKTKVNTKTPTENATKLFIDNLPVSSDDLEAIDKKIESKLKDLGENQLILISNKNPLVVLRSFIIAIDMKLVPIMISTDTPEYQMEKLKDGLNNCSSYLNDRFTKGDKRSEFKNCFGCLTSGTTGNPKIYFYDINKAKGLSKLHCDSIGLDKEKHLIQTLPLYHSYGVISYIFAWLEIKFELHLKTNFMGLDQIKDTHLKNIVINTSPTQLRFLMEEKAFKTLDIHTISVGGGSIDISILEKIKSTCPCIDLYTTYGLSEAGPRVSTGKFSAQKNGYIGLPLPTIEVAILDSNNKICKKGLGQLLVKTPFIALNISKDNLISGFLKTRDTVEINSDGEIFFKTREDDLINVGGLSVYPKDIEQIALDLQGITDALVTKKENEKFGEIPILIAETELNTESIRAWLKGKLTPNQMPKEIYTLDKFPRFSLNKINRTEVVKLIEGKS